MSCPAPDQGLILAQHLSIGGAQGCIPFHGLQRVAFYPLPCFAGSALGCTRSTEIIIAFPRVGLCLLSVTVWGRGRGTAVAFGLRFAGRMVQKV